MSDPEHFLLFFMIQLSTDTLLTLSLVSFSSFYLSDQIDVLGHSFLGPDAASQGHNCDLDEDFKLWSQSAVDASCG